MKKHWITYSNTWKDSPLAYWVHIPEEGEFYDEGRSYLPKAPNKEVEGFPIHNFECDGFIFEFSSSAQIEHFLDVISKKVMPTSIELSKKRKSSLGPNRHWLSRLPGKTKSFKFRKKLSNYIKKEINRSNGQM